MALGDDDALRTVDHARRHLLAPVGGQAVEEDGAGGGRRHQRLVDGEALERPLAGDGVVLLAHRHPRVGVHGVGAGHRVLGPRRSGRRSPRRAGAAAPARSARRRSPAGRRSAVRHPARAADLAERAGDVVVVADPGDRAFGQRPERLLHRQRVGERLQRVRAVGQQVDDRHRRHGRHPLEHRVVEHAGGEHGVEAGEDPGDVLHRLAVVEADLLAPGVDRVAAELDHGHLRRVAGARRRLLEDQRRPAPGERRGRAPRADGAARSSTARTSSAVRSVTSSRWRTVTGDAGQHAAIMRDGFVDLVVGHGDRRREAKRGRRDRVDDEAVGRAAPGRRPARRGRALDVELGGEQQAPTAHGRHAGQAAERGREPVHPAARPGAGGVDAPHLVDDGEHGGGRDRRAAVRAAVVAGREHGGDVAPRPACADRHTVAHRLGHRHHVGRHAGVLEAEPRAGAAEPGLDLVDDHQRAGVVAQLTDRPQVAVGRRVDAALALHGFDQHRRHGRVDGAAERVDVGPRHVAEARRASVGTARAWSAGRWRRAWRACGRGSCRRR